MESGKVMQRLFFGVDFKILDLCIDEKVKFIKKEIFIALITVFSSLIFSAFAHDMRLKNPVLISSLIGVLVFLSYQFYLSNYNFAITHKNHGFLKWLLSTSYAVGTSYCFIRVLPGLHSLVVLIIVFVVISILFYIPVRFDVNNDSLYVKLYRDTIKMERLFAEQKVNEFLTSEMQRQKTQIDINEKADKLTTDMIAQEIAKTRTRLAKEVLNEWEKEQRDKIKEDVKSYIISK